AVDPARIENPLLSDALQDALDEKLHGAATALCVVLGDRGDASVLLTADSRPSPLAAALAAAHPAVRFAALRGVMGLAPEAPFPGSSRVAPTLIDFAGAGLGRTAVVATPNLGRSATIAGQLAATGIDAQPTNNGGEAIRLAQGMDVELVLIDLAVLRPTVRETVFRLRRQTPTATTPIGLLAPDGRLEEAKAIAAEHTAVLAFPRPQNAEAVGEIATRLAEAAPAGLPTAGERAELAAVARGWAVDVLRDGPAFYGLRDRSDALQQAVLNAADAQPLLAALGTPASQLELLGAAGRATEPIETRRGAAEAFRQSVDRFGVLLTTDQLQQQYDRYNASGAADADTQAVLGDLLDAIESRRKKTGAVGP
ncbi:MAG: hypothetical protein AAF790_10090, partial [Planctomycetota bacterium]